MLRIIEDLAGDWRRLDERVEGMSNEIEAIARQDAGCERLMSVPGHLQRNGGGDRRRERAVTLPPGTELLLWVKGLSDVPSQALNARLIALLLPCWLEGIGDGSCRGEGGT
jgi:hypothetical protein